jgi:hypothetical protein
MANRPVRAIAGGLLPAALALGALVVAVPVAGAEAPEDTAPRTRNVVLVTFDGVRIQEMFGGLDEVVAADAKRSGIYDIARARTLYDRPTPEARRAALMPYFWGTLAPQGVVLGDRSRGSIVAPRNPHAFSYPGYMEILTGRWQPEVTTNDLKRYPHTTFLEFARHALGLAPEHVAVFSSWEAHRLMASREEGAVFVNAGYERVPTALATAKMEWINDYQLHQMALWEESRPDSPTFHLALEYLKARRPRVLYIALGETDDWAHARRYDRLLDALHIYDEYLRLLWETIESMDGYHGRTTLVLTTDHGRGIRPKDWVDHDAGVRGSEDIWVAVIGPDTPDRGALAPAATVHQADVAATILKALGLDPREFDPMAGPPIAAAFPQ